ncbi:NAD(P)H-binding protein [Paenibacillus sp. GSMTC-2017]|uniref:NAD(P)H-binding protein n=1 Tax=Paenibacillus sp. GSMTC-2017 TaxID=2794350 RepID=UPI0018D7C87A|nr:NAD(P)H-binding protein [Paenibacillus sp. GSMTC-2017]MBH5319575.1 NAD(P)H-binding protein [Paenibacillus sp. GSMTC-2017]
MSEKQSMKKPILVIGGMGKTGRRVVERLAERGIPSRIGSRSSELPFDWQNRSTWAPILENVEAVFISYYPDLAMPGAADDIRTLAKLALAKGIRRLVLLSGRGEAGALASEQALQNSGADWTIVRASWFSQNFSESFLLDSVLSGTIALPIGDVTEPFIDAEDIADVAVAALTEEGHTEQLYELTGPRLLTFAQVTEEIALASKRDIAYVPITKEQFVGGLEEQNLPVDFTNLLIQLFTHVLDGRNSYLTDGVQRALGREPRDFSDYAQEVAKTGIWDQVQSNE